MNVRKISIILAGLAMMGCAASGTPAPRNSGDLSPPERLGATAPDWQEYSPEVFRRAQAEGRLILLSVQASWCHWCHVMNDTTYQDPTVLQTLDRDYVAIRVDAEARPDIAERYREYHWPATAFLNPSAEPILALRGYRNSTVFRQVLAQVQQAHSRGEAIIDPARFRSPEPDVGDLGALQTAMRRQLDALYDTEEHGWGSRQKYPYAAPVEHALFRAARGEPLWRERALETLRGYARLIDPEFGGMYQYSVRGVWDRPHFEKIAPIQAGAITAFVQAYEQTGEEEFLGYAQQVRQYVSRFLRDPEGGFYSTQDADLRTATRHLSGEEYYHLNAERREALGIPRVDETRYANLNGMLISAYARLYAATGEEEVLSEALDATEYVEQTLFTGRTFLHAASSSESDRRFLADQAWMLQAYLNLHEVTSNPLYLDRAERLAQASLDLFRDASTGALYAETVDPDAVGVFRDRRRPLEDGSVMARSLIRLSRLHRGDDWDSVARDALLALGSRAALRRHGRQVGHYLLAIEELTHSYVTVSVVGDFRDDATQALVDAARNVYDPRRLIVVENPNRSRYPFPGEPVAYLCNDTECSSPLRSPETLPASLEHFIRRLDS